jgi:hypothetical protein
MLGYNAPDKTELSVVDGIGITLVDKADFAKRKQDPIIESDYTPVDKDT